MADLLFLTEAELDVLDQARCEALHLRLDSRWKALTQQVTRVGPGIRWAAAAREHAALAAEWTTHSKDLKNARAANDLDGMRKALRVCDAFLQDVEVQLASYLRDAEQPVGVQKGAEYIVANVLSSLQLWQQSFEHRTSEVLEEIRGVKREVVITKAFGAHVKGLKDSATRWSAAYVVMIVLTLIAVASLETAFDVPADNWGGIVTRLAVAAPFVFLLYFLFHQHKIARLTALKYQHLEGFLNGGGNELAALLAESDDDKRALVREFHSRLADAFLSVDDVTSAIHRAETPLGELARAAEQLDKIRNR
jgi:hypothetical protein